MVSGIESSEAIVRSFESMSLVLLLLNFGECNSRLRLITPVLYLGTPIFLVFIKLAREVFSFLMAWV